MTEQTQPPNDQAHRDKLASMNVPEPDELLKPASNTMLSRALLISLVAHLLIIGLTSFGLYADWAEYGLKMPAEIDTIKKEKRLDAIKLEREAVRQAEQEKRLAEAAKAEANSGTKDGTGDNQNGTNNNGQPKPPAGDVEDPLKNFEFDPGDLDL